MKEHLVVVVNNPYARRKQSHQNDEIEEIAPAIAESTNETTTALSASANKPRANSAASALVISASDKAGMDGIDRSRIDSIILRESGNSLFMQQQRKRDLKVDEKIAECKRRLFQHDKSNPQWRSELQKQIDKEVPGIIAKRPIRSTCVVVDMDMFYMACELLARPDLIDKPSCVGGGMILTSNYKARRYGVRSAMAGWIGDKLVEELSGGKEKLIHVPSNFDLYQQKSAVVRSALAEFDPNLRAYSLDEAYLDMGPYLALKLTKQWDHQQIKTALAAKINTCTLNDETIVVDATEFTLDETDVVDDTESSHDDDDDARDDCSSRDVLEQFSSSFCERVLSEIVHDMRNRVCQQTGGLTCSAGLAPNFLLAKIASDKNKPNGQCMVGSSHDDVIAFLYPMATRKVSGIGRVTDKMLNAFSISTVQQLFEERALVRFLFQRATSASLLYASLGCSPFNGAVADFGAESCGGQKGISRERTFSTGRSWAEINARLEGIGQLLSSDMKRKNIWARNITIKVKLHTFDCLSRSKTMSAGIYIQNDEDLVRSATEMLRELRNEFKGNQFSVRLLGIRCSNFRDDNEQKAGGGIERFLQHKVDSRTPNIADSIPNCHEINWRHQDDAYRAPGETTEILLPPLKGSDVEVVGSPLVLGTETGSTSVDVPTTPVHTACIECPLCQKSFASVDNDGLNRHIDQCLNGSMVRQAVREARTADTLEARKKRRLLDYFGSSRP
jgi:DNA polymerase kappa